MAARGRLARYINNEELTRRGFCVVHGAVTESECSAILEQMRFDIAALGTGIDLNDARTHTNDRWPQTNNGLIQSHGTGHWPSAWMARKSTLSVWQHLFGCTDLLCFFDGISIVRPRSQNAFYRNLAEDGLPKWLHSRPRQRHRSATHDRDTRRGWQSPTRP